MLPIAKIYAWVGPCGCSKKMQLLEQRLSAFFPHVNAKAEFAWAGCFGSTDTGLPVIGQIPGMKHTYAILAFGGNGMTFSRIAAEILRAELTGKQDPDAGLFKFSSA